MTMSMNSTPHWKIYSALSVGFILITTAIAFIFQLWVVTAVPIGFLFGFFMQKGDLCGASAFSEVLLVKDWRKVHGLWVCIVASISPLLTGGTVAHPHRPPSRPEPTDDRAGGPIRPHRTPPRQWTRNR